ncbi:MAG TPA: hypothetical protein VGE47_17530 [Burkholderiaceae bacterium]
MSQTKYQEYAEQLVSKLEAQSVLLIVTEGIKGDGASLVWRSDAPKRETLMRTAAALDFMAAELRRQAGAMAVN